MRFTIHQSCWLVLFISLACSSERHDKGENHVVYFDKAQSNQKLSHVLQQVEVLRPIISNGPRVQYELTRKILGIDNLLFSCSCST